jgi:hypothetical protein
MAEAPIVISDSTVTKHIWHILQATIQVEILNQCSNFELTSPVYFCDGAVCDIPLDQRVVSNTSTETKFRIYFSRFTFQGAIMYEVRATSTPLNEISIDNRMTETNGNVSTNMRIIVAWKVSRIGKPRLFTILLEHDNSFHWDEKDLRQLLQMYFNRLKTMHGREETTWLMQDGTVLKTTMGVMDKGQYKLQIAISEGVKDEYTTTPVYYELRS